MPIYFKFEGIEGDATHADHDEWMEIQSMDWEVRRTVKTLVGAAANRESTQPEVGSIRMRKITDKSSTKLLQQACTGTEGKDAKIHFVTTGNPGETYIEYELKNAIICSYTVDTSGDRPAEQINLNFTKFEVRYTPYNLENERRSPRNASYNIATGKKS